MRLQLIVALATVTSTARAQSTGVSVELQHDRAWASGDDVCGQASQVDGSFTRAPAAPLAFEVRAIDLEGQSAQMITKPGAAPATLRIVRALNANHFIEVLNEGFLGLTTVYDKVAATGEFPAVHSRHVGVLGQAVVAQYLGSCKSS